jgi:hypothetical protein
LFSIEFKDNASKTLYWSYKYLLNEGQLAINCVLREPIYFAPFQGSFQINPKTLSQTKSWVHFLIKEKGFVFENNSYLYLRVGMTTLALA